MPATISAGLLSATPVAAAERPVNAFSSEITTGMSAPPIGSTTALPSSAAASSIRMKISSECEPATITTPSATATAASRQLTGCWAAPSVIGRPGRSSWSLPKAMFEPQNEIEPMIAAKIEKTAMYGGRALIAAGAAELRPGDQEHRAAADAVEQRDHLRHRRHPHPARRRDADRGADRDADHDQRPSCPRCALEQRRDHGDRHADRGDPVAAHRGARPGQAGQPVDEQREGDDVEDVEEVGVVEEARRERSLLVVLGRRGSACA